MARNTLGFDAGSLKLASPAQSLAPIKGIPGFTNGKKRSVGGAAGVPVVLSNAGLWAWGVGSSGVLGLGNTTTYSSPKQVGGLSTWSKVSIGNLCSFSIKTDGTFWSWGQNNYGQLGLGNTTDYSSPKQVGALTTWSKVSAGRYNAFAIMTDGTLWSWGNGYAGGHGDTTARSSPKQVGALTTWSEVAGGKQAVGLAIQI